MATAEELSRQKEQLMMTEQKLDDINSTLRNSEKHIQGVRSVFGSIRNYFSGHSTTAPPPSHPAPQLRTSTSTSSLPHQQQAYQDHHPGLRNKPGLIQKPAGGYCRDCPRVYLHFSGSVDEALDRNLDDMASGLARLKGLAQGLNSELSDHNQILDRWVLGGVLWCVFRFTEISALPGLLLVQLMPSLFK